jgi:hypothetical protein
MIWPAGAAMGRWQALIDEVIADLETETPGEGLRTGIRDTIWKKEKPTG